MIPLSFCDLHVLHAAHTIGIQEGAGHVHDLFALEIHDQTRLLGHFRHDAGIQVFLIGTLTERLEIVLLDEHGHAFL